jgi:hypothetical protein
LFGALAGRAIVVAGGVVVGALSALSLLQPARTKASAPMLTAMARAFIRRELPDLADRLLLKAGMKFSFK